MVNYIVRLIMLILSPLVVAVMTPLALCSQFIFGETEAPLCSAEGEGSVHVPVLLSKMSCSRPCSQSIISQSSGDVFAVRLYLKVSHVSLSWLTLPLPFLPFSLYKC